jgi:hypothetical protein
VAAAFGWLALAAVVVLVVALRVRASQQETRRARQFRLSVRLVIGAPRITVDETDRRRK